MLGALVNTVFLSCVNRAVKKRVDKSVTVWYTYSGELFHRYSANASKTILNCTTTLENEAYVTSSSCHIQEHFCSHLQASL